MRRRRRFVKWIHRNGPEYAEFYRHRLLERGAALGLGHIVCERRPRQFDTGAFGLGRGGLRFGAADRGDAAFAARDALRRLMQIADRAFATDRAVIGVLWRDAEAASEQLFRIAVAPAQEIDDVERLDVAEQVAAAVRFGAPQRGFQQGERLEPIGDFFRTIGDFADADDDGNAVFGDGGGWVRHFLVSPSWTIDTLQMRLLRHQRVHMLHRLDEIFLEFLHHGACGFHAVDQADALSDKIADEVARLRIA